jgi:hypothetical protein
MFQSADNFLDSKDLSRSLNLIKRDYFTTYDQLLIDSDPEMKKLAGQIERDLTSMEDQIQKMTRGNFKWSETVLNSWQWNLKEVAKRYVLLPEKHMVDLITLKGFRDIIKPFHIRILLESSEELFENLDRIENLEVISYLFEVWMRLQLMSDVNFLPRIDSKHIQLMDPFMRQKVRQQNRNNKDFKDKYLCKDFDLKKFVNDFLER